MLEYQEHELLQHGQSSCVAFRVTASAFSRPAEDSENANAAGAAVLILNALFHNEID
jgi:hypothetical protein